LSAKGQIDSAISFFEFALAMDTTILGLEHKNVARDFGHLGTAWALKGNFEIAIPCYERALSIYSTFLSTTHSKPKDLLQKLAIAYQLWGWELLQNKRLDKAVLLFEKAKDYAHKGGHLDLLISCLRDLGNAQKQLGNYLDAVKSLDFGLSKADSLATIFLESEKALPDSIKSSDSCLATRDAMLQRPMIRQLQCHKIGCLYGMGRRKEAKSLTKQLIREATAIKDEVLLQYLKNDGWLKK
jgi:tetratricopeptide (TPR) repeat protein